MRKIIRSILVVIIIVLVVDLCFDIKEILIPPLSNDKEILNVSAERMWAAFEADKESSEKYYKGKTVSITGNVAEKAEIFLNEPCILLENGVDSIPDGIFCFLSNADDLERCEIGDEITITGECGFGVEIYGDAIWIFLSDSQITYN